MSAKQTMICSFSVSMLVPQEKHSWYFCVSSAASLVHAEEVVSLFYSVYWWENECNKKQAFSKYLGFRKSCFDFYKTWSQNAAAGSLHHRLPLVCIWASTRRTVWGWQPSVHTCKLCHFTHSTHFSSALPQAPLRLWQKGISSTKRSKWGNWHHVLVPRKYEQELERYRSEDSPLNTSERHIITQDLKQDKPDEFLGPQYKDSQSERSIINLCFFQLKATVP